MEIKLLDWEGASAPIFFASQTLPVMETINIFFKRRIY